MTRGKPRTYHPKLDSEFWSIYTDVHASAIPTLHPNKGNKPSGSSRVHPFALIKYRKPGAPVPSLYPRHSTQTQANVAPLLDPAHTAQSTSTHGLLGCGTCGGIGWNSNETQPDNPFRQREKPLERYTQAVILITTVSAVPPLSGMATLHELLRHTPSERATPLVWERVTKSFCNSNPMLMDTRLMIRGNTS